MSWDDLSGEVADMFGTLEVPELVLGGFRVFRDEAWRREIDAEYHARRREIESAYEARNRETRPAHCAAWRARDVEAARKADRAAQARRKARDPEAWRARRREYMRRVRAAAKASA